MKPMEHKAFTGFVWRGCFDQESRLRVITLSDDTPVYTSTPVNILSDRTKGPPRKNFTRGLLIQVGLRAVGSSNHTSNYEH